MRDKSMDEYKPNVYVGCYKFSPVKQCEPSQDQHPRNFQIPTYDCFSNHPLFVDLFDYQNVLVISDNGTIAYLSEHPHFDQWKDEFKAGEFWTFVGEEWINQKEKK